MAVFGRIERPSLSDTTDQMSSKDTYERISFDMVAAARATFESGRRAEAIDLLRRLEVGGKRRAVIAEALQELTTEHQRLLEQERRAVREVVDAHLKAAEALLESGRLPDAWSRACDALQLAPSYEPAITLEARLRTTLDDQPSPIAPEQKMALRHPGRDERPGEPPGTPRRETSAEIRSTAPSAPGTSRAGIVAMILTLAALLMALAARTC
jgi:hypothetical protein